MWSYCRVDLQYHYKIQPCLKGAESIARLQTHSAKIFWGRVGRKRRFVFTRCNPPSYQLNRRWIGWNHSDKWRGCKKVKSEHRKPVLNFGGTDHEFWCEWWGSWLCVSMGKGKCSIRLIVCFGLLSLVARGGNFRRDLPYIKKTLCRQC